MAAFNLIIAYDLVSPGQNYEAVQGQIKKLGQWEQLQYSLFYVNTALTPGQVYNSVKAVMDSNDRLIVINAFGFVTSSPQNVIDAINRVWPAKAA